MMKIPNLLLLLMYERQRIDQILRIISLCCSIVLWIYGARCAFQHFFLWKWCLSTLHQLNSVFLLTWKWNSWPAAGCKARSFSWWEPSEKGCRYFWILLFIINWSLSHTANLYDLYGNLSNLCFSPFGWTLSRCWAWQWLDLPRMWKCELLI